MKPDYISFSGATSDLESEASKNSAELYCQSDVLNYDNFDYIQQPTASGNVYCVAFNAKVTQVDTTAPTVEFLGFRDQSNGGYDNVPAINACGATNTSGYIAWEWKLTSDPEPVTYHYKITSGPTAVGYTANTTGTYYNGGIPMEGTYTVEVTAEDANGNVSSPAQCSVTYSTTPVVVDQCPNITGTQESVPSGKHQDNEGNCVDDEVVPVCTDKTMDVVSGTDDVADSKTTTMLTFQHSAWDKTTLGTNWIWNLDGVSNPTSEESVKFTKTFTIAGVIKSASLSVLADNVFTGKLNTYDFAGSTDGNDFANLHTYDVKDYLSLNNNLSFTVTNWAQTSEQLGGGEVTAQTNPAGLNYKLHVVYNDCDDTEEPEEPEEPVNTAPTIKLTGSNSVILTVGGTYTEMGAACTDAEQGTLSVNTSGTVDAGTVGTYTVNYSCTDGTFPVSTTRTVTVNPAPVVENPQEPIDVCKNIEGNQSSVPEGKHQEGNACVDNGGGGGVVPLSFLGGAPIPQGRVLGESTTCGIYLEKFLRKGYKNDIESVKKVQDFLNKFESAGLPVTGTFGNLTDSAVKKFQNKYASEILIPWGLKSPTGIVYQTTTNKINKIMCPELNLGAPTLIPIDQNPEAPKL